LIQSIFKLTEDKRLEWFNDPTTYEDQEVSRKRKREDDGHDELQQMRLFYECREKARLIERLIMK